MLVGMGDGGTAAWPWWPWASAWHSLQRILRRLCLQMAEPPQSLHCVLWRSCGQMAEPLQSLQWLLRRLCSHSAQPPHSLQSLLSRLCLHLPRLFLTPPTAAVLEFGRPDVFRDFSPVRTTRH
jgi:hypothetical protein